MNGQDRSWGSGGSARIGNRARLGGVLAAFALVLAACGGSATPSPAGSAAASPPASQPAGSPAASGGTGYSGPPAALEYSIWGDPAEIRSQQAIVDAFTAANPTVTVNVTVADWDQYWDKLQTGLAGGAAPDVFAMDGPLGPDYQTRDVLLDLTPFIEQEGYDLSQLDENAVRDFTTSDGQQFGLPRDLNVIALFYNKQMFDDAGIPYPDDTWDWAKLVEVGKQLTKDTNGDGTMDQWGLYTETTDMENAWSSFVWQAGGDILSEDGTTSALDQDASAAGIQFLQDLIWKEKVSPDPALFAETGDAFEQGVAAMEINGSWLVPTHEAAGISFGIAPLPKGSAGAATSVNPTGAVVYKNTKSPEAAWALVKYLASPEAQKGIMALKASVPVNKEILGTTYPSAFEGAQVFADALAYAHLKPSFRGYNDFTTVLQTELDENVFNNPSKTAKEAIAAVNDQLNQILADNQ
ncbi:MAG TPA: sugar ABC transporter substrate-binding protein [Candidatus Limnocylindrales bacterium]|nr:sugar ABC transporter substrate-binding protein [Candidatus Limnocylindrales bacterium]